MFKGPHSGANRRAGSQVHTIAQLQMDNHVLEQAVAGFFARAAGRSFDMGLARPRAEE